MGKVSDITTTSTNRADDTDVGTSSGLPDYSSVLPESAEICCISLYGTDKIRLIEAPFDLNDPIRETILNAWGPVQKEERIPPSHQFKLNGYPWVGAGAESVKSRRLLYRLMKTMVERGWNLIQAADVSKDPMDLDALFFERMTPGLGASVVDSNVDMFALSFNKTDLIRIIDAPSYLAIIAHDTITQNWPKGIQREGQYEGSYQFKMNGNPFSATKEQSIQTRVLLCRILAAFRTRGYKLYASVGISSGQEGRDLESWVFRRVGPSWS